MQASIPHRRSRIAFLSREFSSIAPCVSQITNIVPSSMSKLVEHVSKKPVPEHQKNIIFEVTAEDQTEEDVEVPYVMVKLTK